MYLYNVSQPLDLSPSNPLVNPSQSSSNNSTENSTNNSSNNSTGSSQNNPTEPYRTVEFEGFSFEINSTWKEEHQSNGAYVIYYPKTLSWDYGPFVQVNHYSFPSVEREGYSEQMNRLRELRSDLEAGSDGRSMSYSNIIEGSFGENALIVADAKVYKDSRLLCMVKSVLFYLTPNIQVQIRFLVSPSDYSRYEEEMEHVINSVRPA